MIRYSSCLFLEQAQMIRVDDTVRIINGQWTNIGHLLDLSSPISKNVSPNVRLDPLLLWSGEMENIHVLDLIICQ